MGPFEKHVENYNIAKSLKGHWLDSLSDKARKHVLDAMRKIEKRADMHWKKHAQLTPRHGEVSVGGAHFDEMIKGEALWAFNGAIGKGYDPQSAYKQAQVRVTQGVVKWNKGRVKDYQVHRSHTMGDSLLTWCLTTVSQAAKKG